MPNAYSKAEVTEFMATVLTPFLGDTMAHSSLDLHVQKLGLEGDFLSAEQAAALAEQIGGALVIFVGREKSAKVVAEMLECVRGKGTQK